MRGPAATFGARAGQRIGERIGRGLGHRFGDRIDEWIQTGRRPTWPRSGGRTAAWSGLTAWLAWEAWRRMNPNLQQPTGQPASPATADGPTPTGPASSGPASPVDPQPSAADPSASSGASDTAPANRPVEQAGEQTGGTGWVCPECWEPAVASPPRAWQPAWGPAPGFSHADGEPLCPVMGPDGYVPATPVDGLGNPAPADAAISTTQESSPASAGTETNTDAKENEMSMNLTSGTGSAGSSGSGGLAGVGDGPGIRVGELASIDDLESEVESAAAAVEALMQQMRDVVEWVTSLGDRFTGARFSTAGLKRAMAGLGDVTPPLDELTGLQEALNDVQHEIDQTDPLREAAEALDAEGDVDAFRTS